MPLFSVERATSAPVESVWHVLADFGNIGRWNPGVKHSALTSHGDVAEGTSRHCDLAPLGAVEERIVRFEPQRRLTVHIFETTRLPITEAVADFRVEGGEAGTRIRIDYRYTLNRIGRFSQPLVKQQLSKGIGQLADALAQESQRVAVD